MEVWKTIVPTEHICAVAPVNLPGLVNVEEAPTALYFFVEGHTVRTIVGWLITWNGEQCCLSQRAVRVLMMVMEMCVDGRDDCGRVWELIHSKERVCIVAARKPPCDS